MNGFLNKKYISKCFILLSIFFLSNCTTAEIIKGVYKNATDEKYEYSGVYKVGNPYKIDGKWYYPKEESDYSEIGIASWYGAEFHNKLTANGELFDKNIVSAAHRTLPLPSIIKVTNLENGENLLVRINDRGPFAHNRILDLSEAAAKELGIWKKGTAKVKVEFDKRATNKMFAQKDHEDYIKNANYKDFSDIKDYKRKYKNIKYKSQHNEQYIQMGAFSSLHNANLMKKMLKSINNVFIEDVISKGRKIYRVKVGPFSNENKANVVLSKISKLGFKNAIIIEN